MVLRGCGSCGRCQCWCKRSFDWHTRALYVDVLYIGLQCVSKLWTNHLLFKSGISVLLDHSQLECERRTHKNTFWDCLREEMHLVSLFIVASIAAVFVLSAQYLHLKLDKACYKSLRIDKSCVLPL